MHQPAIAFPNHNPGLTVVLDSSLFGMLDRRYNCCMDAVAEWSVELNYQNLVNYTVITNLIIYYIIKERLCNCLRNLIAFGHI